MTFQGPAFVYYARGDVRVEPREIECGPEELVVKVLRAARCGTDWTVYARGHKLVDRYAPVVLGHELAAEIVAVGPKVRDLTEGVGYMQGRTLSPDYLDFRPGERVTFQSRVARYRNGLMQISEPLADLSRSFDGGYAQYMRAPAALIRSGSVLRIPENVDLDAACLTEPAACALEAIYAMPHAVGADAQGRHQYRGGILPGGRTCVIGSGTVSMICAALARLEGAAEVFMLVRSRDKGELARAVLGPWLQVYVSARMNGFSMEERLRAEAGIVKDLADRTQGRLFDDVISACADPAAQRLMVELYAPEGNAVGACFGGTRELADRVNMDLHHYRLARTTGTSGCSTSAMKTILSWLAEGKLNLNGFIDPRPWTLRDNPAEFFTVSGGLKPALRPWG